jgi:hypothetical protein
MRASRPAFVADTKSIEILRKIEQRYIIPNNDE